MNDFLIGIQDLLGGIFTRMAEFLPALLSAIVILVVGWILARIVASLVRRLADRIGLESLLDRAGVMNGIRQAGLSRSPSEMLATFIFWMLFANFLLAALDRIGLAAATEPLQRLIAFLPTLLSALITLVAGALGVQFLGKMVQAALAGMGIEFHETLANAIRALLLGIIFIIVLEQMGLDVTLLNEVFIILIGVSFAGIALAFGLGGRDVARNVLAGFYARDTFQLGDTVAIEGHEGTIEGIGTLNTEIAVGEERVIVPNCQLTESIVRLKS